MALLFFTDLDGSLLDHEDYSFDAARPVLARLAASAIPVIFVTSKTRAEVEVLRQEAGIKDPFIVENGGGIFFPSGYRDFVIAAGKTLAGYTVIELGMPYARVRDFVSSFGKRFALRGFGDLTGEEVAALTDLPADKAELARQRDFTEPFLAGPDTDLAALAVIAAEHGLKLTRGGRFHHLIGAGQDKGVAVRVCGEIFARNTGSPAVTVGIGDSENDLPMLAAVDIPVLIPRPDGLSPDSSLPGLIRASRPGCLGWVEVVERILDGQT